MTCPEFERFLIKAWMFEITDTFNIAHPANENEFIEGIVMLRTLFQKGSKIQMLIYVLKNWRIIRGIKKYWDGLVQEEKVIMSVPFLTTIDTLMLNFFAEE